MVVVMKEERIEKGIGLRLKQVIAFRISAPINGRNPFVQIFVTMDQQGKRA